MSALQIPKGSLVLVTGATGFLGSSTVAELAKQGYRIRAGTRDANSASALSEKIKSAYGQDAFEVVEIKDYTAPNAFDVALKGVAGVVHMGTDISFSPNTEQVVDGTVKMVVGLLEAAATVPSVKSFVLTSSRVAAYGVEYGKDVVATKDSWADYYSKLSREAALDNPYKPLLNYAASKVEGERAAWKFVQEHKPSFSFSAVLPDLVLGPIYNPKSNGQSTSSGLTQLFQGNRSSFITSFANPPGTIVDVRDVAVVHAGALMFADSNGKRLFAGPHGYHINDFLAIWREAYPELVGTIPEDFDNPESPKQEQDLAGSEEILQRLAGRSWISKKDTVLDNVKASVA